ncbi:MAG: cytochrome c oxidase assembly protein [Actinobacteria bacterium]|nr:cytochrome c oxidase assembly protein [Actinomycetota bacterium]MBW3642314.1 cytochrome c oxidase assembly protein [Actinomycetota bacterium]
MGPVIAFDPAAALVVVVAGVLYLGGVRRLADGRGWPARRTTAFVAGLVVVALATQSGLAGAEADRFSIHTVQHVLLGMVAPALMALGAPVTLALQASRRPTQMVLLRVLHSAPLRLLTHPVAAWLVFGGSLVGLYFTRVLELSLTNDLIHAGVHLQFLVAGGLFCWTAVGVDPLSWRLPHGARLLFVVLAVPVHAIIGLALMGTSTPVAESFGTSAAALADQRVGGGILWATGDLFGVILAGVVLAQWMGHEERVARRHDRLLDRGRVG